MRFSPLSKVDLLPTRRAFEACGRAAVTATLCALLVEQPLLAAVPNAPASTKATTTTAAGSMPQDERVLHALNRLTFGPRPGDEAAVKAMGLNQWFERQLNPGSIDDSGLDARMAEFPGYFLTTEQMTQRFPSPIMLRLAEEGRIKLPTDPEERAIAVDQIAFYKLYKEKQGKGVQSDGKNAAPAGMAEDTAMQPGMDDAASARKSKKAAVKSGDTSMMNDPKAEAELDPIGKLGASVKGTFPRDQAEAILAMAPDARYNAVLAMQPIDLIRFETSLGKDGPVRLAAGLTPAQRETLIALTGSNKLVALEASEARLIRDVYSDRQLEAVMTDFWLNHFNVYMRKSQNEPYMLSAYERETIRPNALGNFETLLVATAKSPAMLTYLDNYKSVGPDSEQAKRIEKFKKLAPDNNKLNKVNSGLNENYGRELMELHTLGVNGGYTQADVTTMAKVFTGWGLDKPYDGGEYRFEEKRHEPGAKMLLGRTIPEGGEQEGLQMLHVLATSPATAHFISEKLAVRFVSDTPRPALVDRMAATFLSSKGDIKSVLRTMWNSPEFWAKDVYRAKLKTPEEFVISALRASGAQIQNAAPLVQSLGVLGMPLYGMQTPNGYSWNKDSWLNTGALVARMNFSLVMSDDRMRGTDTVWPQLLGEAGQAAVMPASYTAGSVVGAMTDEAKEQKLEMLLIGQPVSSQTRQTVLAQATNTTITEQAETDFDLTQTGKKAVGKLKGRDQRYGDAGNGKRAQQDPQAAVMAGLLLGSPEFQKR